MDHDYARSSRECSGMLTLAIEKSWHSFLVDLVLLSSDKSLRMAAAEQFLLVCTRATSDDTQVKMMVTLLYTVINISVKE